MNKIIALLLTIGVGLCFLVGIYLSKSTKQKERLRIFANSLALMVLIGLVLFDFIPELFDIFHEVEFFSSLSIIICFSLVGFLTLKVLDKFIPNHIHHHHQKEKNHQEHDMHLQHIGLVTAISLILHNIIEGIAIFGTTISSLKAGVVMAIGVALHNIPLGIEIALSIYKKMAKQFHYILYFCLGISSAIGGIIFLVLGEMNQYVLGAIISITLGMILYIILFELLKEFLSYKSQKESKMGLACGLIIIGLSLLI